MKKWLILSLAAATMASAQQIAKTVDPVKTQDSDTKKALFLDKGGYYTCPDKSFMYIRKLPVSTEKGKPPTPEDFNYYRLPDGQVVVNGHPTKFIFTCIQEPE